MSPTEHLPPDDPQAWLTYAREDLLHAGDLRPGVRLEALCFDAQQAAEKAMKAVMLARGIHFRYTHDLRALMSDLQAEGEVIPDQVRRCTRLSVYAGRGRYPGFADRVTEEECVELREIAEAVVRWAEERV